MIKLSSTKRSVGLIAIPIVLVAIGYGFLFFQIRTKNQTISELSNSLALEERQDERDRSARSIVQNIKDEREQLERYFIEENDIVSFIETIETLGIRSGTSLEIVSVNVRTGAKPSDIIEFIELTVTASGSFSEVFHMLSLIETLPFATVLNRTTLEEVGGGWRASITFAVAKNK